MFDQSNQENPIEKEFEKAEAKLESALTVAIEEKPADILLLSGGIDSSLLASLDPKPLALTVTLKNKGKDVRYAQEVTEFLNMRWHHIELSEEEALRMVPEVVSHLNSYDPGILNDIPLYAAMRYARSLGLKTVRTGDGGDDLFGGYSFSWSKDGKSLDTKYHQKFLQDLYPHLSFSSNVMAKSFGMGLHHPYLDPRVAEVAINMDLKLKVQRIPDSSTGDVHYQLDQTSDVDNKNVWSKIILRRIARKHLPSTIINRARTDLEYGSGSYLLEDIIADQISDSQVQEIVKTGVKLWDDHNRPNLKKMHAYLRSMFDNKNLRVPPVKDGDYSCSWCGGGVQNGHSHCFTCGGWPANKS